MNLTPILAWVEARAQERSTWIGLISVLGDLGVHIAPGQAAWIASIGVGVAGAIMVFTRDKNLTEALTTGVKDVVDAQAAANAVAQSFTASPVSDLR